MVRTVSVPFALLSGWQLLPRHGRPGCETGETGCVFYYQYGEYSVRFAVRHAACNPLRATGQRAPGRALCTPCLATNLPAAARYLHSLICPLRTGHDSLLLSMTSRRVHAARPGHIHSLSGAMSPDQRCRHRRKSGLWFCFKTGKQWRCPESRFWGAIRSAERRVTARLSRQGRRRKHG